MKKTVFIGLLSLLLLTGCGTTDTTKKSSSSEQQSSSVKQESTNEESSEEDIEESTESSEEESETEEDIEEGSNVIHQENSRITNIKKLNSSGKTTSLGNGTWTVGRDIEPGHYMLTAPESSGNISSDGDDHDIDINIILSSTADATDETGYLTQYETYLFEGATIEISDLPVVNFTAIKKGKNINKGTLCGGDYMVGMDIKPGRYKIKALQGTGNLSSDIGDLNEIFGLEEGDIKETTQDLKAGEMISTDVNYFSLTPVK